SYDHRTRDGGSLQLIDPNTETILAQYEDAGLRAWSPSGHYFSFMQNVSTDSTVSDYRFMIASVDGEVILDYPVQGKCPSPSYRWSPDDRLIYVEPGGAHLIFEEIETRDVTRIVLP